MRTVGVLASALLVVAEQAAAATPAGAVTRVAVEVSGVAQDVSYDGQTGSFSGLLSGVPGGARTVTATAYAGARVAAVGAAQVTVIGGTATSATVPLYDTTGSPAVPDHGPVLVSVVVPSATVTPGQQLTVSASAFDADGDPIAFLWTASPPGCGTFADPAAPTTLWTAAVPGACILAMTASANGKSDARSTTVSIAPTGLVISGALTPLASVAGAKVAISGAASASATVDANGRYAFPGLAAGSYTVTPSKPGFTFTPASRAVTVADADVGGIDFVATEAINTSVDLSQAFQRVDGMGTNVNVNSWEGGQLRPALDLLVDVNGASLLRVIRDPMDWVGSESLIPALHALDPATLQQVYEAPRMQDLWATIAYLNQKGLVGSQIILNFMGWTATWMGGSGQYGVASNISSAQNSAMATMLASCVYYGRVVKGLSFKYLAPFNEPDLNGLEGPLLNASQLATIFGLTAAELTYMGVTDVELVGPDTAQFGNAESYVTAIRGNASASPKTNHYSAHAYGGATWPGTSYSGKDWWNTETAQWCGTCDQNGTPAEGEWAFAAQTNDFVLGDLEHGFPAVLLWEGYDSFWYHHDSYSTWGLLAYDTTTGVYAARKRLYVNAQLTRFIRPGATRVFATSTLSGLSSLVAFYDTARGRLAIVGHNASASAVTANVRLTNLPVPVSALALYWTNAGANLERQPDVPVAVDAFTVTIPADTFFSLANE